MKIGGLGEFENIRKAVQKDDPPKAKPSPTAPRDAVSREDAVEISGSARMLGTLKKIPDVRQEEIDRVLTKLNNGTLMTPEAVRESVARLIENLM